MGRIKKTFFVACFVTDVKKIQEKILSFYAEHGRDLPWRKTTDPYAIWISEVMLQQTQVDRVIEYYYKWLARWPTVFALARASRKEVLSAWMGLGYNNRAIRLHEAAKIIVTAFQGDVIAAMKEHKLIPGVGPYTAAAVRIFSQNEDLVAVDTNIRRILIHEFGLAETISDKELWDLALQCLPRGRSRDWHNALMDYGATQLTARRSGIRPKTKQSVFEGSDRQIRARIVRFLLSHERVTGKALLENLNIDQTRLECILIRLIRDNVIERSGEIIKLKE